MAVLIAGLKGRAKTKGLPFEIDGDFVRALFHRQGGLCYWFGIPVIPGRVVRDPQRPSLDRLDNAKGYTPDNVVLTCMAANLGRGQSTVEQFAAFVAVLKARFATRAA